MFSLFWCCHSIYWHSWNVVPSNIWFQPIRSFFSQLYNLYFINGSLTFIWVYYRSSRFQSLFHSRKGHETNDVVSGHWSRHFGQNLDLMKGAHFICLTGHLLLGFVECTPWIGVVLIALSFSILPPALWALTPILSEPKNLNISYGILTSLQNLGLAVLALAAGSIATYGWAKIELLFSLVTLGKSRHLILFWQNLFLKFFCTRKLLRKGLIVRFCISYWRPTEFNMFLKMIFAHQRLFGWISWRAYM